MSSTVVVKTRKFKKNPLLSRKQVRCNQTFFFELPGSLFVSNNSDAV
jgi:hypothetical protein